MANNSINNIISNLTFGGARPNLFDITISAPGNIFNVNSNLTKLEFLAQSAQLPPDVIGQVNVPYQGRTIKVRGDRTFPNWTIEIINDEDFILKDAINSWHNSLNEKVLNITNNGALPAPLSYKGEGIVKQKSQDSRIIKAYRFVGLFPLNVGEIALNWSSNDQIEIFPVEFSYDYWEEIPVSTL